MSYKQKRPPLFKTALCMYFITLYSELTCFASFDFRFDALLA
jgi:hypothetical protein